MHDADENPTPHKWRSKRAFVVASSLLGLVALALLLFAKPSMLRDIDPIERIVAPILNALGLNG